MFLLSELFKNSLKETFQITLIIFVLMVIIELLVLKFNKQIIKFVKKNTFLSNIISSFFGIIPGCVGTFVIDSAYMSGLVGFGGIIAVMIATSGDESFLMLSMLASGDIALKTVIILISSLFFLGILSAYVGEFLKKKLHFKISKKCLIKKHEHEFNLKHFFKEHLWKHIIKKHIWQIFLWIFVAIFLIQLTGEFIDLNVLLQGTNIWFIFLIASLVALLPISGPNIFLLVLFSKGMIPFSILLVNSIIQDGHGLLPIIGFSIDDAIKIKIINYFIGVIVGGLLLFFGL